MKKTILSVCMLIGLYSFAQVKEGFIKYTMTIESDQSRGINPMSGSSDVMVYFKNEKSLSEMITQLYSMKVLNDGKSVLTLMDAMGQKFFIRKTEADILKEKAAKKTPDPVITYTKEKKKILGYDCTKALLTVSGNKGATLAMVVWTTDKIVTQTPMIGGVFDAALMSKFKGLCLEIQVDKGPVKTRMTATEISTNPIPDKTFVLSMAGYAEKK